MSISLNVRLIRAASQGDIVLDDLEAPPWTRSPEDIREVVRQATGVDAFVLHDGGLGLGLDPSSEVVLEEVGADGTSEFVLPGARPWQRSGWYTYMYAWLRVQCEGHVRLQQVSTNDLSCVLRLETDDGTCYLKATESAREVAVTTELAERNCDLLPEVIAGDIDLGLLLTRDSGRHLASDADPAHWLVAVDVLAQVHTELQPPRALPRYGIEGLNGDLRSLVQDRERLEWWRVPRDTIDVLELSLPGLLDSIGTAAEADLSPTLTHGDSHPMNALVGESKVVWFDWAEAATTHPLIDIGWFLAWLAHPARDLPIKRSYPDCIARFWAGYWSSIGRAPPGSARDAMIVALAHRAVLFDRRYRDWHGTVPGWRPLHTPYLLRQLAKVAT